MTNKELKEEYKNIKFRMGVFQIRNTVNGKIFIEGSSNLDKIWNRHYVQLNFGNHRNVELQKDWNAYGESHFVYEILGEIQEEEGKLLDNTKEIKILEQMFLEELQPFGEKGYNRQPLK